MDGHKYNNVAVIKYIYITTEISNKSKHMLEFFQHPGLSIKLQATPAKTESKKPDFRLYGTALLPPATC